MSTCKITINGTALDVAVDQTILKAAEQCGIEIPAMCYDPRLKPYGACRMCLVEIAGARGPVAACTTPVREGMVISTSTLEIEGLRRTALEFMLAEHYGDCVGPCNTACPAGIDIQGFIALIADGKNAESLRLIKESLPFPASCGRVCPRFCEDGCRRNLVDDPVGIMHLKRYVADIDLDLDHPYTPETGPASGKSVGIVGGGPAGLTAAYYLAIAGHSITVYEACDELGGMLRYAIPEYRLPKAILRKEIATITRLVDEVKCNTKLGKDITLTQLKGKHDAVIIAVGAAASQMIGVDGEDLKGAYGGLDFLAKYAADEGPGIGKRVAIVGGGNTAMDCARTAVRLGADEVTIVYRRSRDEMPASLEEIEGAEEEGVKFRFLANPVACGCGLQEGALSSMTCVEMALGEPDASGRRRPQAVPGSEFLLDVDTVIWATGQTLDPEGLEDLPKSRWGLIADERTSQTSDPQVFATADCVSGPTTVVEACGAAHKTALLVDSYLRGRSIELPVGPYNHIKGQLEEVDRAEYEVMDKIAREAVTMRDADQRAHDYVEIDPGYSAVQAVAETRRCLSCGCQDAHDCLLRDYATEYQVEQPQALREEPLPVFTDHELVVRDPNKCILCGSCVRICAEIQGASALGFTARGHETRVEPTLGHPLAQTPCESCHQCISACPTGALMAVVPLAKPGPFALDRAASVCPECSIGCQLSLGSKADLLVRLDAPLMAEVNNGNLCKHGALLLSRIAQLQRVTHPMVRVDGQLQITTWDEAFSAAARHIDKVKASNIEDNLAVYVSSRWTSEEVAVAAKLADKALAGAPVTGLPSNVRAGIQAVGSRTASFDDLRTATYVMAINADLPEKYPVAAIKIRQAVDNGATFLSLATTQTKLDLLASLAITVHSSELSRFLAAMTGYAQGQMGVAPFDADAACQELGIDREDFMAFAEGYGKADKPVIVVGLDALSADESKQLAEFAELSRKASGDAKIIGLTKLGNAYGLAEAGVTAMSDRDIPAGSMLQELGAGLDEGGFGGFVIAGVMPDDQAGGSNEPFAVCIAPYLTAEVAAQATVVLPGSTPFETTGSMVNSEGRMQRTSKAIKPLAGWTNTQVLCELSKRLGSPIEETESGIADGS